MVCGGRLLHARAAATGNVRSPRVDRRVDGTSIVGESTERRRRRAATSDVSRRLSARYAGLSASDIGKYKLNRNCFADKFASSLPAGFMDRAGFAQEVIAIREGRFTTVYHDFSREEMDEIIAYLMT